MNYIDDFKEIEIDFVHNKIPTEILKGFGYQDDKRGYCCHSYNYETVEINRFCQFAAFDVFERHLKEGNFININGEVYNFDSIKPLMQAFSDGFLFGYNSLENNIKDETSFFGNNTDSKVRKIIEIAKPYYTLLFITLGISDKFDGKNIITEKGFYEDGIKQGEHYKAWYIILNNAEYFEKCFTLKESKGRPKEGLSLREIALQYFYLGTQITRLNGDKIATEYGHKSGEKLFQHYTSYCQKANRIEPEKTEKKNKNKIELFEKIIELLNKNPQKQQSAKNDLDVLLNKTKESEF